MAKVTPTGTYYYHTDGVGSIRALTDVNGDVVARFDYEPFGDVSKTEGSYVNQEAHRFTGKPQDPGTGLYYFNARYYDSEIGRFISVDPARDGMNWYAYAAGNPLRYVDPDGEVFLPAVGMWVGVVIGGGYQAYKTIRENGTDWRHYDYRAIMDGIAHGGVTGAAIGSGVAIAAYFTQGVAYAIAQGTSNLGFKSGAAGEQYLANLVGGTSQKFFRTSLGGRYIDQLAQGVAHESKVGYTTLTEFVRNQVLKDAELVQSGVINGSVWHFFKSAVTDKVGASQPLLEFLKANGIGYIIHQ